MKTNADALKAISEHIPQRTLVDVTTDLADAKRRAKGKNAGMDLSLARLMLKAGRLTDEARVYVERYLAE